MNASAEQDRDVAALAPLQQRLKRLRRVWLAMQSGRGAVFGPTQPISPFPQR